MKTRLNYLEKAKDVLKTEIDSMIFAKGKLDHNFCNAVDTMMLCLAKGGKIVVTGVGKNYHIAQKISSTLASTGSTSVVLNPVQAMHGDLGIIRPNDVLLALSYSGESDELLTLLPFIKRQGVKIIALTGNKRCSMAKHSDIVICAPVKREACPFNMAPTSSTTVALAVGDALAIVMLYAHGFKKEDYARLHPAGAIGRALLMKVNDIMRTGNRLAKVRSGALIKDALLAMTEARSGSACVVDAKNRLLGIFTDGDLRRYIADYPDLTNMPIDKFMTKKPITVKCDKLAVDALKIFEEHNIDDLVVLYESHRVIGAIDLQDLPKFKII